MAEDKPKFVVRIRHGKVTIYKVTISADNADFAKVWGRHQADAMGMKGAFVSVREADDKSQ